MLRKHPSVGLQENMKLKMKKEMTIEERNDESRRFSQPKRSLLRVFLYITKSAAPSNEGRIASEAKAMRNFLARTYLH